MAPSIDSIVAELDGISPDALKNDKDARFRVLEAARRMVARLESPFEQVWRWGFTNFNVYIILQIMMDIGLWEGWLEAGGKEASLEELLDVCKVRCDLVLLRRLLRLLTAEHVLKETGKDRYQPTPLCLALGDITSPVAQTLLCGTYHGIDSTLNFPKFLSRTSYEEPVDAGNTNYMDLTPERLGLFARCQQEPKLQETFTSFMRGITEMKDNWTDIYDTTELLEGYDEKEGDAVLLVDIGGAHGVDVQRLLDHCPGIPSERLVLQDLPEVLALFKGSEKVKTMAHDFFTPQPIQGSRAYFLHAVLHDWDDRDARRILAHITAAMSRGYSKLLLYESIIPDTGANVHQTIVDISLMHLLSAAERTELQWRLLLESANLKVVKIWSRPSALESVIEVELA